MSEQRKNISLRRFQKGILDIHEVVDVSRRDPSGDIQIIGFWTPYVIALPRSKPIPITEDQPPVPGGTTAVREGRYVTEERAPGPRLIKTPEEAAAVTGSIPAAGRAYPKADQVRGKRR